MPVITRCEIWIYALQKFNGRLVIRVLWDKFAMNGKVKDFAFWLLYDGLQIFLAVLYNIQRKAFFYFCYNAMLLCKWG